MIVIAPLFFVNVNSAYTAASGVKSSSSARSFVAEWVRESDDLPQPARMARPANTKEARIRFIAFRRSGPFSAEHLTLDQSQAVWNNLS